MIYLFLAIVVCNVYFYVDIVMNFTVTQWFVNFFKRYLTYSSFSNFLKKFDYQKIYSFIKNLFKR